MAIVLMDMQLPVMDGYTDAAANRDRGIEMPIIALNGNAMSEDRDRCLDAGCTDFLTKPLEKTQLIAMISKYATKEPTWMLDERR